MAETNFPLLKFVALWTIAIGRVVWRSWMKRPKKPRKRRLALKNKAKGQKSFFHLSTFKYSRCSQFKIKVLFKDNGPNSFLYTFIVIFMKTFTWVTITVLKIYQNQSKNNVQLHIKKRIRFFKVGTIPKIVCFTSLFLSILKREKIIFKKFC